MKTRTRNILIALSCLLVGLSIGAATQERIRWPFNKGPVTFSLQGENGAKVEFGLRSDGVVVWREIMPATTNSPAEQEEVLTNIVITGITNLFWTNNPGHLFTNIYIPPWHHPEWTNWEEGARWWSNQIKPFPGVILTNGYYYNELP